MTAPATTLIIAAMATAKNTTANTALACCEVMAHNGPPGGAAHVNQRGESGRTIGRNVVCGPMYSAGGQPYTSDPEPLADQTQAIHGLHDRQAHVRRAGRAERVAWCGQHASRPRQPIGRRPAVAIARLGPEVEGAGGHGWEEVELGHDAAHVLEPLAVRGALDLDVVVVGESGDGRGLDRPGHEQAGVLA